MIDGPSHDDVTGPRFLLWSFRDDVYIEIGDRPGDSVVVHSRWDDTTVSGLRPAVLEAMRRMSLGPISLHNVIHEEADRHQLDRVLEGLHHLVVRSFGVDAGQPMVSVVPLTPQAHFEAPEDVLVHPVRLSRFAQVRTDGANYVIESPLSLFRVILHRPEALADIGPLIRAVEPVTVTASTLVIIRYLMGAGMVVQASATAPFQPAEFAEDNDPALITWRSLDLMFHTRSTLGRHDHDFGATYPLGERGAMEPAVKAPQTEHPIALPRPNWENLLAKDTPLTVALEGTRPDRHYGDEPVTVDQLGELLYRTIRVRAVGGSPEEPAASDRPYQSSGDSYELEVYATIGQSADLARGVYHYDPLNHTLEPIEVYPGGVDELLEIARVAANLTGRPPALLTITARFRRLSWKFDGLSYALVLKNVGALTQTLSLVSTSMGLGSCRLDSGDVEISPRLFGLDWRVESNVGGIVVGHPGHEPEDYRAGEPVNDAEWPARARVGLR